MGGHVRGPFPLAMVNSAASMDCAEVYFGRILFRLLEIQVVTDGPLHRTFGAEGLDCWWCSGNMPIPGTGS